MLVLNHGNEGNGKGGLFLFILNRICVWLLITTYNSGIFRRPGFNRAKGKGRLNIFDDVEFKRFRFLLFLAG